MKKYKLQYKRSVIKDLRKIPDVYQRKILMVSERLQIAPFPKGVRKIAGGRDLYRTRVGNYRIIYCVSEDLVEVVAVAHRQSIYDQF